MVAVLHSVPHHTAPHHTGEPPNQDPANQDPLTQTSESAALRNCQCAKTNHLHHLRLRATSLLRISLLRMFGANFPGDSLETEAFHPLKIRIWLSQTSWKQIISTKIGRIVDSNYDFPGSLFAVSPYYVCCCRRYQQMPVPVVCIADRFNT